MFSFKQLSNYFLLTVLLLASMACEDDSPSDSFRGDIIISNEGNYGGGNGSISFFNRDSKEVNNTVFAKANAPRKLEASVQSVSISGNTAFIVCNASSKIEVVDASSFEAKVAPIEDDSLISPRYLTVANNKAYVSVWGPFNDSWQLTESKVAVIDLDDYSIIKYIDTEDGPEDIIAVDNKVYVANSYTNKLSIINTNTDEVEKVLELDGSPVRFVLEEDDLWVSVGGAAAQFLEIDTEDDTIETTIDVSGTNTTGKFDVNDELDMIYFVGAEPWPATATVVYQVSNEDATDKAEALISGEHFYMVGSDPATNTLYVGNSNSFQGEGTLLHYDADGNLLETYAVGVGPNGIHF
ncbi:hypothetical protein PZB74_13080 [Porifericola rhodea]|uniref:YncE family protein n=1 Tax=Porifericola rhodea TaxID=930972 RepID=UPI002665F0D4|nr:DUF5074 domain-containing protein [Porifericola rhodea]WKN29899.1 hypothetical protein PZB74_13080 [Porifericola rhodea]